ncbi:peptidoglycan DD-metalloendopeptidase family protein [Phaeovibrio sulfidiphilus]|uniref:peptidoglycan DD-metalloendopeptidase family protein n=1 Tax=Phaeovibrio sulfidiphilus TaxID=1220600 RepID=UPI00237C28DF|nr:peptidoglycan DD-metalloendopeptidase family protein [Phaeovibrio sulfidiphilus]
MTEFDPRIREASRFQRWLGRVFPERQIMVRTDSHVKVISLTSFRQLSALSVFVLFFGWMTYSSVVVFWLDEILAAKEAGIADTRNEYKGILAELGVYRSVVGAIRETLDTPVEGEDTGARAALASADPARAAAAPGAASGTLQRAEQRELLTQLAYIEHGLGELSDARNILTDLEKQQVEVRQVLMERDLVKAENRELQGRVVAHEERIQELEMGQLRLVERFAEITRTRISAIETALGGTGVDLPVLMRKQKEELLKSVGQGGPFIPLDVLEVDHPDFPDASSRLQDAIETWGTIVALTERIPLTDPLHNQTYRITSPFGVRSDPFNGLAARHEGVDMGAPRGTPIAATAPGKVVYAGWRGRYGRVVDVDHGVGLLTRYAHMDAITVQMGQKLEKGDVIGTVGSTGRSTGPHLHYEIRVNGRPRNPQIFMKAGKDVFEG